MRKVLPVVCGLLVATAAAGAGAMEYSADVAVEFGKEMGDNRLQIGGIWYFLEPVDNDTEPFRLQPFLQKASFARATFATGPRDDESLLSIGGRYVFPDTPVGVDAGLGFGDYGPTTDQRLIRIGGIFYIRDDNRIAAEAYVAFWKFEDGGEIEATEFQAGARFVAAVPEKDWPLEIFAAFRSTEVDLVGADKDSGLALEARCFFTKEMFAGLAFTTTDDKKFTGSFGYSNDAGFDFEIEIGEQYPFEIEIGKQDKETFLRISVGCRF